MNESRQMLAVRAFNTKHGEFYSSGNEVFYADGSYREKEEFGIMWDSASVDRRNAELEWRVQSNIVQFYRLKLESAVTEFDDLNTRLNFSSPSDPDAEIAKLKRLQLVVTQRRKELAQAEAALEKTQWGRQRQAHQEAQQERVQRAAEFQSRRRAIRI
jgi:hypothetical protein